MSYEEIVKLVREEIKNNLRLESEEKESYSFQHGTQDIYTTTTIVKLMLDDECLGEVYVP